MDLDIYNTDSFFEEIDKDMEEVDQFLEELYEEEWYSDPSTYYFKTKIKEEL